MEEVREWVRGWEQWLYPNQVDPGLSWEERLLGGAATERESRIELQGSPASQNQGVRRQGGKAAAVRQAGVGVRAF